MINTSKNLEQTGADMSFLAKVQKIEADVRRLRPEFEGLDEVGALLKGKKVKDGGVIKQFELLDLMGPVVAISVVYKVDGHPYTKKWYVTKRKDEDEYRIEYMHNKVRVGTTPKEAAKKIASLLTCPIKIEKNLGTYKGWDLYLTTKEGGKGGHAAKGSKWYGTDVSYSRKPDPEHIKKQLQLGIDHHTPEKKAAKRR